jgi:hypothetical protein
MTSKGAAIAKELSAWGLKLPGVHRKSPWPYRAQAPRKLVMELDERS